MHTLLLTFFLASCTTTKVVNKGVFPDGTPMPVCNRPNVLLRNNAQWFREDEVFLTSAHRLCVDQFGGHSCLSVLVKYGQNNYQAVCRANTIEVIEEK